MECWSHFSTSTSYRALARYFRAMMTGYGPHFLATCRTCRINASARLARTVCPKYKPVTRYTRPVAMANLHLDSSTSKKLFLVQYLGEGLSFILLFGLPRRYFHSNGVESNKAQVGEATVRCQLSRLKSDELIVSIHSVADPCLFHWRDRPVYGT